MSPDCRRICGKAVSCLVMAMVQYSLTNSAKTPVPRKTSVSDSGNYHNAPPLHWVTLVYVNQIVDFIKYSSVSSFNTFLCDGGRIIDNPSHKLSWPQC